MPKASKNSLDSSGEQQGLSQLTQRELLKANAQLIAKNRELRTVNVQLIAKNRELRTVATQLSAQNQKLRKIQRELDEKVHEARARFRRASNRRRPEERN